MHGRKPFTTIGLALAAALLAACASNGTRLAASEGTSLQQCQWVTGSRIRPREATDCKPRGYPSRSFTAEELQSTGAVDLADALRQLDPAFH
jgi:hypothetical protein